MHTYTVRLTARSYDPVKESWFICETSVKLRARSPKGATNQGLKLVTTMHPDFEEHEATIQ